eukprot:jgi/Mesvir1/5963/Mv00719-RA.1
MQSVRGTPPTQVDILEKFYRLVDKLSNEKGMMRMLRTELAKLLAVDYHSARMAAHYLVAKADVQCTIRNLKKIIEVLEEALKGNKWSITTMVFCVWILGDLWLKTHDAVVGNKLDYLITASLRRTDPMDPREDPMGSLECCPGYLGDRESWLLPETTEGRVQICRQILCAEQARSGRPPKPDGPNANALHFQRRLIAARSISATSEAGIPGGASVGNTCGNVAGSPGSLANPMSSADNEDGARAVAKGRGSAGRVPGRPGGATRAIHPAPMMRLTAEERWAQVCALPPEECAPLLKELATLTFELSEILDLDGNTDLAVVQIGPGEREVVATRRMGETGRGTEERLLWRIRRLQAIANEMGTVKVGATAWPHCYSDPLEGCEGVDTAVTERSYERLVRELLGEEGDRGTQGDRGPRQAEQRKAKKEAKAKGKEAKEREGKEPNEVILEAKEEDTHEAHATERKQGAQGANEQKQDAGGEDGGKDLDQQSAGADYMDLFFMMAGRRRDAVFVNANGSFAGTIAEPGMMSEGARLAYSDSGYMSDESLEDKITPFLCNHKVKGHGIMPGSAMVPAKLPLAFT